MARSICYSAARSIASSIATLLLAPLLALRTCILISIDWQAVIIDRNRTTRAGNRFVYKVIDEHGHVFDMYDTELNHYYVGYKAPTESEHVYVAKGDKYEIAQVLHCSFYIHVICCRLLIF